jgi:hypothetical protein
MGERSRRRSRTAPQPSEWKREEMTAGFRLLRIPGSMAAVAAIGRRLCKGPPQN